MQQVFPGLRKQTLAIEALAEGGLKCKTEVRDWSMVLDTSGLTGRRTVRLRALGGQPSARPSRELAALCEVVADPGISDRSKLAALLARSPAPGSAPLREFVERVEGDAETRALLETIDDEERASLAWLHRMRDTLEREDA